PALCEHVRPVRSAHASYHSAHHLLGVSEPVNRRGVDPVDATLERVPDRRDGFVIVLRSPSVGPAAPAGYPRAESDARDFHVGSAELSNWKRGDHGATPGLVISGGE